jgi:glyoxylase-like metal-dependent hydrolase (beta-lactamase superfamily II)
MKIHKLVFSPIEVNTYILYDESGDCAILDCGCYDKKESDKLGKFITLKNLKPVLLLNTHCHLDHIFGNKLIQEKYGLRPFSSELDEMNRKNAVQHAMIFGLTMDNPPEPQGFIEDNQTVKFGANELLALHVPGHSPGSLAFYSRNDNCVFTGDALFAGSIGRTDLPGGDFNTLIKSIKSKLFVLPPSTVVYAGHGKETTIGNEIKSNPYFDD